MKELLKLRGIITVLNTPFTGNNLLDLPSLKKNIFIALKAGVTGFLIPGMASEVDKLSDMERKVLVRTVLEEVKRFPQITVIGGVYGKNDSERLSRAKELIKMGCDGILVNIPYEEKSKFVAKVKKIASLKPPFLMLQDWSTTGNGIPIKIITELYDKIDCFRSIKIETLNAGLKYTEVLMATDYNLHVAGGWAVMQMIEALDRGVHVIMPTGMHEIYTEIYRLHKAGRRDEAVELFEKMLPIVAFSNQNLDISIQFFKRLLFKQGIYSSPRVREPITPFDAVHEKISNYLIQKAINLIEEVNHKRLEERKAEQLDKEFDKKI